MAHRADTFWSILLFLVLSAPWARAQNPVSSDNDASALLSQNQRLEAELQQQQKMIEALNARLSDLAKASAEQQQALQTLQGGDSSPISAPARESQSAHEIRISGEAALAFFRTGPAGQFPNSEFRVDEAKVYLEAPVWKNSYFFAGLDLVTREASDEYFHLGELYADFEDLVEIGNQPHALNLRVGRIYIPFGEEYQYRGVMENALISRSIGDLWGIDEGLEIYGQLAKVEYALAVQNGGHKTLHDFDSDKAVTARVGYNPARWVHLSASAIRTGRLSVAGDATSELWFASGFFRALGNPATTTTFRADVLEGDAAGHWRTGYVRAALGEAFFGDNDRAANNSRQAHYYYIEANQDLAGGLYAVTRFSRIRVAGGLPLVGQGDFATYYFHSALTDDLHRLSLGLGYRFAPSLLWKAEYNIEGGHLVSGEHREEENLLSTEIALQF